MSGSDDSSLFANTKRFRAAVALFNGIDGAKLPLVLARILGGLGGAKGERVFSEAEEAQLRELLGLDEAALADLLGACAFVFEQAAYGPTAPERLRVELAGAGVEGAPADAFAAVWQEEGAAFVARLKERAVLAPQHLQAVDWQLCVRTADSCGGRAQQPQICLNFRSFAGLMRSKITAAALRAAARPARARARRVGRRRRGRRARPHAARRARARAPPPQARRRAGPVGRGARELMTTV